MRDATSVPEILLVRRHGKGSFANAYVFPGGTLEPQDGKVERYCRNMTSQQANTLLGLEEGGLDWFSAAIRELFEEVGVLLATTPEGLCPDAEALQKYRDPLQDGTLQWQDFLQQEGLELTCEALTYCAFWVTPREIERRYATRFFVARLPAAQVAEHCGRELIDSRWVTARDAIAMHDADQELLPRPTRYTLEVLSRFETTAQLLDWAKRCARRGVERIEPAIINVDERPTIVMPGDPRYPDYADDS